VGEKFNFCWEPRGNWDPDLVKGLCNDLDLWHVVDPFTATSVTPDKIYFRLHGKGGWRYEYDDDELRELALMLRKNSHLTHQPYVFFNNVRMTQDALRFRQLLQATP
jgi:uncharacterized protein YecE (DUF72 family)